MKTSILTKKHLKQIHKHSIKCSSELFQPHLWKVNILAPDVIIIHKPAITVCVHRLLEGLRKGFPPLNKFPVTNCFYSLLLFARKSGHKERAQSQVLHPIVTHILFFSGDLSLHIYFFFFRRPLPAYLFHMWPPRHR